MASAEAKPADTGREEGFIEDIEPTIERWVVRVTEYSSQYNEAGWAAASVIGHPQVYPRYGDINGAWAQETFTDREFVVVEFEEALYMTGIEIYETLNAGAVYRISAMPGLFIDGVINRGAEPAADWVVLWETPRPTPLIQTSRIFSPVLTVKEFFTNRLKIELDCTVSGTWCEIDAVKLKGKRRLLPKSPPMTDLSNSLSELVNCRSFSDVTFEVEGQLIPAHKAILAVRSKYFKAMFCSDVVEAKATADSPIKIEGVSKEGFLVMMTYLYTNTLSKSMSPLHASELMRVADRFSLDGMRILCYRFLCSGISADNAIDIYVDSVQKLPKLEDVEELCVSFVSRNLHVVTQHESFCKLPQDLMLNIIQSATAGITLTK